MTRSPGADAKNKVSIPAVVRAVTAAAVLSLLAACSSTDPRPIVNQSQEAAQYASRARGTYTAPGPASDPWGPYVREASTRFDVPQRWIREVMRQESGGKMYQSGRLITSWAGAMGLMQVMPQTYDELRVRYDLGDDAYDPHNNIMAGTAYIREMYDIYGSPGFLAAYNAGPKRLDDYLSNSRGLPEETRKYVANIGPYIIDSHPVNRSAAEDYAMNDIPVNIPGGLRYGRASTQFADASEPVERKARVVQVAARDTSPRNVKVASRKGNGRDRDRDDVQVASRVQTRGATVQTAMAVTPAAQKRRGFQIIPAALADTIPAQRGGGGGWAVQVGAFANQDQARDALGDARQRAQGGTSSVSSVKQGKGTLYRARLTNMSRGAAMEACQKLTKSRNNCIVLSPDSQS